MLRIKFLQKTPWAHMNIHMKVNEYWWILYVRISSRNYSSIYARMSQNVDEYLVLAYSRRIHVCVVPAEYSVFGCSLRIYICAMPTIKVKLFVQFHYSLVLIRHSTHQQNKLHETCCMKCEVFVWWNISIYFNGTKQTTKQETYVSWNIFHETY